MILMRSPPRISGDAVTVVHRGTRPYRPSLGRRYSHRAVSGEIRTGDMVKPGAAVIDVGINSVEASG